MKRCPKCDFQYLDSDEFCDLDGTLLDHVDAPVQSSREATPTSTPRAVKAFLLLGIPGAIFGAILLFYSSNASRRKNPSPETNTVTISSPSPSPEVGAVEIETPLPEPEQSPSQKPSPAKVPTSSPARLSSNPISTESENAKNHNMIIRLTDGGTIAADEAWRTRDGIWYRRNGIVTLLKRRQVKSIERAPLRKS